MKTPMLVAVRLKGKRGHKESFVQSGGETYASFETWPTKQDAAKEFRRWAGFDGSGWDNGPA